MILKTKVNSNYKWEYIDNVKKINYEWKNMDEFSGYMKMLGNNYPDSRIYNYTDEVDKSRKSFFAIWVYTGDTREIGIWSDPIIVLNNRESYILNDKGDTIERI